MSHINEEEFLKLRIGQNVLISEHPEFSGQFKIMGFAGVSDINTNYLWSSHNSDIANVLKYEEYGVVINTNTIINYGDHFSKGIERGFGNQAMFIPIRYISGYEIMKIEEKSRNYYLDLINNYRIRNYQKKLDDISWNDNDLKIECNRLRLLDVEVDG